MADQRKQMQDDDVSRCGSFSGETFVSRGSRRGKCPSLHQQNVDQFAKNLREYHLDGKIKASAANIRKKSDFNRSFHHFRFVVAMFSGASVGLMLFLRYNISISILRMVNQTHLYLEEHPEKSIDDFLEEGYVLGGEFLWNNEIVAIILAWYMFSYTLPQTLTTRLSNQIGCNYAVPISLTICAIANLLTPAASYIGWEYVVACRLINGVGASAILPSMIILLESWMRYDEMSLGLSVAQIFNSCMTAVTPLITGYLTNIHWSRAFYYPGIFTLGFCVLWVFVVANDPESSWLISERELSYLCECNDEIAHKVAKDESPPDAVVDSVDEEDCKPKSLLQILKKPTLYAYVVIWVIFCSSYTGFVFVLPTYMRQFLKIRISENGFYCFLIQLGCIVAVVWPQQLLQLLQKRFKFSINQSRIICYGICCFAVAATWIYIGFFHQNQLIVLFLNRCFHNGGNDIIVIGTLMSNFAKAGVSSIAFAMVNTVGNFSITITSTLIGWLLDYTGSSREGWQIIFTGLALSQLVSFLVYTLFITSAPIKFTSKSTRLVESHQNEEGACKENAKYMYTQASVVTDKTIDFKENDNFDKLKDLTENTEKWKESQQC